MFKSVGSRLLAIILAITITGMGLIAVIGSVVAGTALIEQTLGRIQEATAHDAHRIETWVLEQTRYVEAISVDLASVSYGTHEAYLPILQRHEALNDDYYVVYVGFPDGSAIFSDLWIPDPAEWVSTQRGWYIGAAANPDTVYITELYQDADTGELCITISKAIVRNGAVAGVVAVDVFLTVLTELVTGTEVGDKSYANLTDADGNIIFHANEAFLPRIDENGDTIFMNLLDLEGGYYAELRSDAVLTGGESHIVRGSTDGIARYYTAYAVDPTGWFLYTAIPVSVVEAPVRNYQLIAVIVLAVVACIAAYLIFYSLKSMIMRPVSDVTNAANRLAAGDRVSGLTGKYVGEIALLADSFRGMEAFNVQQGEWLEHIAGGDLSIEVKPRGESDYIGQSIMRMLDNLNGMFANINESAHQVAAASRQIEGGSGSLAKGSMQQAASIEELSASMTEISEKTKQNADIADEAAELSRVIRANAEKGSAQMDQMMMAVKEINDASSSISNVIKTIDEIAFQTQILALNAAVEAARAGSRGKGFTVVADEVRNLAGKSAEAAKNSGALIDNTVEKANLGLEIAVETAASLKEIVDGINRSSAIAAQIAQLSREQSQAISHINSSVDSVADIVQQNSATSQESAAASSEMSNQAVLLELLISKFKLR